MATTTTWATTALYLKDFRASFDKGWDDAVRRTADPPADSALTAAYNAGYRANAGSSEQMMRSEYSAAAQDLAMRGFQVGFDGNTATGSDTLISSILFGFPGATSAQVQNLLAVYQSANESGNASRKAKSVEPAAKSNLVNNLVAGGIFVAGLAAAGFVLRLVLKKRPDEATLHPAA